MNINFASDFLANFYAKGKQALTSPKKCDNLNAKNESRQ